MHTYPEGVELVESLLLVHEHLLEALAQLHAHHSVLFEQVLALLDGLLEVRLLLLQQRDLVVPLVQLVRQHHQLHFGSQAT